MSLDITGRYRYPPPNPEWLARYDEEIIDPDQSIVDAHHHIWVEGGSSYLLDDLVADLSAGHNVVATICVQAHHGYRSDGHEELRCVGETETIAALVATARGLEIKQRVCAGFVAYADLSRGAAAAAVIQAHLAAAPGLVRGIRHGIGRDPLFPNGIVLRPAPAAMLADPGYRAGLAEVARHGLSYDAMLYHCQIPELTDMANALPELPIVLDHFGCPIGVGPYEGHKDETFRVWSADMRKLARCPNVSVKLGGLGMTICGAKWHEDNRPPGSKELADAWQPHFDTCIEAFGAERCMFESNFPVDKSQFSYRVLWNAYKRLVVGASPDQRAALFHDTAARFYHLGLR